MSEIEKQVMVPQLLKTRIDTALLELRLAVKTLEGTLSVFNEELDNICKACEHFKIPQSIRVEYAQPQCTSYGECDVKTYKEKLKKLKEK